MAKNPNSDIPKHHKWPADKIQKWPIERLLKYPQNPRLHSDSSVDKIVASIKQFGWTMPVLVDEGGVLIAGHGRVAAAAKLGLKQIPVMIAEKWTDDQKRAYRIADNQIPMESSWDVDLLEAELASLRAVKFDLEPLGLDNIQLPEIEDPEPVRPKPNRSKTTLFISIANAQVEKARKTIVAALDKAKIAHSL